MCSGVFFLPQKHRTLASVCPNFLWYYAKSPCPDLAARNRCRMLRGIASHFGQRSIAAASRSDQHLCLGLSAVHQHWKRALEASFAVRFTYAIVGGRSGPGGVISVPSFARWSASSFPCTLECPGTQYTMTLAVRARAWNWMKAFWELSAGLPRRQATTEVLSRQMCMG